jgi:predicted peroxiredoxin
MTAPRPLVVKCTAGVEAPERCAQAFTVTATAAASGARVSLWLTGEATWLAVPGRAEEFTLPHSAPLADLRDTILAAGSITVCSQCAARRSLTPDELVLGVRIAGATSFVDEVLRDGVQALVY